LQNILKIKQILSRVSKFSLTQSGVPWRVL